MVDCIENTGKTLNLNNQGIVKYLCEIEEERKNLEMIIQKQYQERKRIEADIERLTYKLCLINKSLSMRIKAKNNYDKTIEEIRAHYDQLVDSSNKLRQIVEKTQQELDDIMNKKTGTPSGNDEVKMLYMSGDPGPDDCPCTYNSEMPTREMSLIKVKSKDTSPVIAAPPLSNVDISAKNSISLSNISSFTEMHKAVIDVPDENNALHQSATASSHFRISKQNAKIQKKPDSQSRQPSQIVGSYKKMKVGDPPVDEDMISKTLYDLDVHSVPTNRTRVSDVSKNLLISRLKANSSNQPKQSEIVHNESAATKVGALDRSLSDVKQNKLKKKRIDDVVRSVSNTGSDAD